MTIEYKDSKRIITSSDEYKVHSFTSDGTFQITSGSGNVDYLVIAGGGGGSGQVGGGGGAGGYRTDTVSRSTGSYTVTVGGGGTRGTIGVAGGNGGNSVFDTITSTGGGGGASAGDSAGNGGSGGGASESGGSAGTGISGQGFAGGLSGISDIGGGGGGASEVGANASGTSGGVGGDGLSSSITGSAVTRAGGGGGCNASGAGASGGSGGGGAGIGGSAVATSGTANTGGGGGGARASGANPSNAGGLGGSGIVIVKYNSSEITATGGTITTFSEAVTKPTDVQDNSILVEKDTARRYWFSKPTTFEQNFDSNTGHTANQTTVNGWYAEDYTKIAYDGTNHYLKYAAMGSTNWGASFDLQQSGNNGVGSAINSSKWTLRFKWHILTNSGSTGNGSQGAFGISSVPATTLNNQDFMGFSMRQHASGGEVGLFNATLDNNNPMNQGASDKKFVTGNLSAGTTYYAEIIRDGDKCTTTLRTGSHTGTQVGSMERTVTNISGLRYLYYKAQQDSGSATHTSYIDDIDFINGADTWTGNIADLSGCIAYYNFEQTSGNLINQATTASGFTDGLGADLVGTNSGATQTASGIIGNAWDFDGTNDYVSTPTNASIPIGTEPFSFNIWVNPDNFTGYNTMFSLGTGASNQALYITNDGTASDGGIEVHRYNGTVVTSGSTSMVLDTWQMVTLTYSGSSVLLYLDGVQVGSGTYSINTNDTGIRIGKNSHNSEFYDGSLDEFSVWTRVLTPTEITTLYNSGRGKAVY